MPAMEWLELLLPCTVWIQTYKWREYLQADIMAGVTVGTMLVPRVFFLSFFLLMHFPLQSVK
jgi:sulfate transporter 4